MRLAILVHAIPVVLFHLSVNAQTTTDYFSVIQGASNCEITDDGQCFQNTNYNELQTKYDYSSSSCTIEVLRSTSIKQQGAFKLKDQVYAGAECSDEYLEIEGVKHCGTSPPLGTISSTEFISSESTSSKYIYFRLDGDRNSYTGFRFCSSSCSTCTSSSSTSSGNQDTPGSSTGKQDCATYGAAGKPFDCGAGSQFKNNTCATYGCEEIHCCEEIPVDTSLPKDLGSSMLMVSLVALVFVCMLWLLCMYCHSGNKAIYTNKPMKNVQLGQVGQV
jgi:hypothetical protein|tara:strand:- start:362 stop:1186 length:825 start_codon:yes stop_codon:yes gene_type:complete